MMLVSIIVKSLLVFVSTSSEYRFKLNKFEAPASGMRLSEGSQSPGKPCSDNTRYPNHSRDIHCFYFQKVSFI